jgi:hypothetical protein
VPPFGPGGGRSASPSRLAACDPEPASRGGRSRVSVLVGAAGLGGTCVVVASGHQCLPCAGANACYGPHRRCGENSRPNGFSIAPRESWSDRERAAAASRTHHHAKPTHGWRHLTAEGDRDNELHRYFGSSSLSEKFASFRQSSGRGAESKAGHRMFSIIGQPAASASFVRPSVVALVPRSTRIEVQKS